MIQVTFSANMRSRFIDSNFARDIERRMIRFYGIAGASVMTTAPLRHHLMTAPLKLHPQQFRVATTVHLSVIT